MEQEQKIKFAIVGCGHIGKRHAEMILRNPEAELVALIDMKDPRKLGVDHLDIPFYHSLEDFLLSHPEVDVINIATPNGLHAAHALQALDAGKHVVIEKPMAISRREAEQVIASSKQAGREVFVVMQNRYSPPSVWIKEVLSSGKLGAIYMVQLNCYWNRDKRYYSPEGWHGSKELDGGTLFTQFSHFIDMMYWLFGDIEHIQSRFMDFNHAELTEFEDSGFVYFDFLKGGKGCISYSTAIWDRNLESSLTIIAENGSVKIGGQYMNVVEYCHIKDYQMPELPPTNPGNDYGSYKGSAQNHHYVIGNVIDVLKRQATVKTPAKEGMAVVDMIERIYKAGNS